MVYMGAEDIRRQAPNVLRMRASGRRSARSTSGSATLKDAINEAMRDWVTNVATTHYVLGSAVGPHPYPTSCATSSGVIGDEARRAAASPSRGGCRTSRRMRRRRLERDRTASRFIGEPSVRLSGVEAAGEGLGTAGTQRPSPAAHRAYCTASRSYLLQDEDGQVVEAHSISAGLDYPGIGPQLSALFEAGRLEILSATDDEAVEGSGRSARTEGILPALETGTCDHGAGRLFAGRRSSRRFPTALVLLGLSGRGDKDLAAIHGLMARRAGRAKTPPSSAAGDAQIRPRSRRHAREGRTALVPYAVAGYPDSETSSPALAIA